MLPFKLFFKLTPLLIVCLFAAQMMAQTTTSGDIAGTVTDPSGAVIAGATVTITSVEYGSIDTTVTSTTGAYRLPSLRPGNYKVAVTQTGFTTIVKTAVVAIGQVTTANVQLQIGQANETVEVSGAAPLIQTENANLSTSFTPQQVDLLPNGGNDLTAVAQTAPGVVMNNGGGYGNFSAFGLPATANLFTVNGNDEMDPYLNLNNSGATNLLLGKNEVQETAVVSNGYTGQYGRGAGAQVDYATKSGTNDWHGNLTYWYNTAGFNGNDWFNNNTNTPIPEAINNQWAASVGGPIKKDKLFFFLDNEGLRFVLSTSNLTLIPSQSFVDAFMGGPYGSYSSGANLVANNSILSGALGAPTITPSVSIPFYQNFFNLWRNASGAGRAVPVTNAIDTTGNLGCGDINVGGNLFPSLAAFGGTSGANPGEGGVNMGGGTPCADYYRSTAGAGANEWILAARVDYNLSNADKMFFRFRSDRGVQPTFTDSINPIFNATSNQPQNEGQLNWTHTLSATALNQLVVSGSYYSSFFVNPQQSAASAALPFVFIDGDLSSWGQQGLNTLGGEGYVFPQGRAVTQYQIIDDLSITKGAHALKMGVNFRRNDITDATFSTVTNAEMFSFSQTLLAGGFAEEGSQRFAPNPKVPTGIYSLGLYFQDEYRVNSNLKLTMTLRADRNSNMTCGVNCFSYTSNPFNDLSHNNSLSWASITSADQNNMLRNLEKVVFQPRFGFAWTPFGQQNTVVRGGVGLFSDLYPGTLADSYIRNAPFSRRFSIISAPFSAGAWTPIAPGEPGSMLGTLSGCNTAFGANFTSGNPDTFALDPSRPATCTPPIQTDQPSTFQNPKYLQWNFQVQQAIGSKTTVSLNYVGNRGYDEIILNPWLNAYSSATFGPGGSGTGTSTFGNLPFPNTSDPTLATCSNCSFLHSVDGHYGNVLQYTNNAVSNYNGLTATVTRRFSHGFNGSLNYTWAHALDEVSNGGLLGFNAGVGDSILGVLNPNCLRCGNYSNADYDVRHNLTANYVWDLPFKASGAALNRVISGWSVSGTFFYHTGYPYGVVDTQLSSISGLHNVSSGTLTATFLGGPTYAGCSNTATGCLSLTQFTPATAENTFGNIPRNYFRGPGYFDSDFTVLKTIPITERWKLGLGANAYNVFNHPNFANPVADIASGSLGTIQSTVSQPTNPYGSFVSSAVSGRVLQLQARVTF